jgi:hypothetical protein
VGLVGVRAHLQQPLLEQARLALARLGRVITAVWLLLPAVLLLAVAAVLELSVMQAQPMLVVQGALEQPHL